MKRAAVTNIEDHNRRVVQKVLHTDTAINKAVKNIDCDLDVIDCLDYDEMNNFIPIPMSVNPFFIGLEEVDDPKILRSLLLCGVRRVYQLSDYHLRLETERYDVLDIEMKLFWLDVSPILPKSLRRIATLSTKSDLVVKFLKPLEKMQGKLLTENSWMRELFRLYEGYNDHQLLDFDYMRGQLHRWIAEHYSRCTSLDCEECCYTSHLVQNHVIECSVEDCSNQFCSARKEMLCLKCSSDMLTVKSSTDVSMAITINKVVDVKRFLQVSKFCMTRRVSADISNSVRLYPTFFEERVCNVERINNKSLEHSYKFKKSTMSNPNEMILWHGTRYCSPYYIVSDKDGLDPRRSNGGSLGYATYFSNDIAYSIDYGHKTLHGTVQLILCRVLCGETVNTSVASSDTKIPCGVFGSKYDKKRCFRGDSMTLRHYDRHRINSPADFMVGVYSNTQILPVFIVTFRI
jgi:hypothetical protein